MALSIKPIEIVMQGKHPLLTKAAHWERIDLSDVAIVQNGFAFKSELFTHSDGMPLIRIRDIDKGETVNFYSGTYSYDFVVKKGDFLIGMDGDFNTAIWKGSDGLLNQRVCRLIPSTEKFSSKFLFYCLQPYLNAINAETSSVTVKHLSSRTIGEIPLPLPPLPEQYRIVAKIEALFSELDKGIESFETAREQLKIYRQALLKHAFSGKLTEQWRAENPDKLESAEALLQYIQTEREQRYQQQLKDWEAAGKHGSKPKAPKTLPPLTIEKLAELPDLPKGWGAILVAQLLAEELCNGKSVKDRVGGFPVLRLNALVDGKVDLSIRKEGDWTEIEAKNYIVKDGDFLVSRGNGSKHLVGRGGFVRFQTGQTNGVAFPDTMIRVVLHKALVSPPYFAFCWDSRLIRDQIEKTARTTAGIYKINQELIDSYVLPLPSIDEQKVIADLLSNKLSIAAQLDQTITTALQQAEALRQSILKKAFSGQLVPQDPNDEPASVLLERIQAEKAAVLAQAKTLTSKTKSAKKTNA